MNDDSEATKLQQRLAFGSTSHYRDAEHYDRTYKRRTEDIEFYVQRCKDVSSILEFGVGTGRIAMRLAQTGAQVTGVDLVPQMLKRAELLVAAGSNKVRNNLTLVQGDIRGIRLGERFHRVIAPFNMFMHLYSQEDLEQALATVTEHLLPDGEFVFDVLMPDQGYLNRNPDRVYKGRSIKKKGRSFRYRETFDYDPVSQVQTVGIYHQAEDDLDEVHYTSLSHRYLFPEELKALIHYNGFSMIERFGAFDGTPLSMDSESQIIVAKRT